MKWISVEEALPVHGQAVLVRRNQDNWHMKHTVVDGTSRQVWRWQAAIFKFRPPDDYSPNNRRPYVWEEFGPGKLFGQDVSHWAAISDPSGETS